MSFIQTVADFHELKSNLSKVINSDNSNNFLNQFRCIASTCIDCCNLEGYDEEVLITCVFNFFVENSDRNWHILSDLFSQSIVDFGFVENFYNTYESLINKLKISNDNSINVNVCQPSTSQHIPHISEEPNETEVKKWEDDESPDILPENVLRNVMYSLKKQKVFKPSSKQLRKVEMVIMKEMLNILGVNSKNNQKRKQIMTSNQLSIETMLELASLKLKGRLKFSNLSSLKNIEITKEVLNGLYNILFEYMTFLISDVNTKEISSTSNVEKTVLKLSKVVKSSNFQNIFAENIDLIMNQNNNTSNVLAENVIHEVMRTYEKYIFPVNDPIDIREKFSDLPAKIKIENLDNLCQQVFKDEKYLNLVQSVVFDTAYNTNENLLVCAPTSCGKTNIALLCVLREINKARIEQDFNSKIVYIAPMKALASEITRSFKKRLSFLGFQVRELTGDMQLTPIEIASTNLLVTTPEKWDAVSRKMLNEMSVANFLKLLIIDEIHILNTDRGSVIESVVARTLRQVESSQSMIRIVALSATLPNFMEVARFLRVNSEMGLFYFDANFRPINLEQHVIGVRNKNLHHFERIDDVFNNIIFDYINQVIRQSKQAMIFVHTRKSTAITALALKDKIFGSDLKRFFKFSRELDRILVEDKNLANLIPYNIGIHHAGLSKSDRKKVEKLFLNGQIKLLVCTSTLAWGVNLPAYCVIIKGTEVYDTEIGRVVDLSVLDIMQIFGRAGRPQFENAGLAVLITPVNKLSHYLHVLTNRLPIESSFSKFIADNLNAEIVLGSISNIDEAFEWIKYTYFFVRMQTNPYKFALNLLDVSEEPNFRNICCEYIRSAALKLNNCHLIRYDELNDTFYSTDLGVTASYFYVSYKTIEIFLSELLPNATEFDVLNILSKSTEFENLKVRNEEIPILESLIEELDLRVVGGVENTSGKVSILLQCYISRIEIRTSSLVSDILYIGDNICRIARALFHLAIYKNYPTAFNVCLSMCKMLEKRQWNYETPLKQFNLLNNDIINKINEKHLEPYIIKNTDVKEIARFIHNEKCAPIVKNCANYLPDFVIEHEIQPITNTVIRIQLKILPTFVWHDPIHGKGSENIWVWITDPETNQIYHIEEISILKVLVKKSEPYVFNFTIPVANPKPSMYLVNIESNNWLGSYFEEGIYVKDIRFPDMNAIHTDVLPLNPLPIQALENKQFEKIFRFEFFNPFQTQYFHILYNTDENILIGAPTGSGKTVAAELAILRVINNSPQKIVVYVAPLKALVKERMKDWSKKIGSQLKIIISEVTGDTMPRMDNLFKSTIIITTPEKWDGITRKWRNLKFMKNIALIIFDEIHLLGEDRGPTLEVIVSRMNYISEALKSHIRFIGLSTAIANVIDMMDWLKVKETGLFNFRPNVRPVPLEVHILGYPGKHYCPRMLKMNKPAYQAICSYAMDKPCLIFVSSRRQTRLTADALINFIVNDKNRSWSSPTEEKIFDLQMQLIDAKLIDWLRFGIGIHHAGLSENDREIIEKLFCNREIKILISTSTLAWGVNFPASLVIIKGTEFYDAKTHRYVDMPVTDILQMMGRAGRPQFDTKGTAVILVHDIKKSYYKKFLYEPFPIESNLLAVIYDHFNAEISSKTILNMSSAINYLEKTYFFRRLLKNPDFYNLNSTDLVSVGQYLKQLVNNVFETLAKSQCIDISENYEVVSTPFGTIASYYYISHITMNHLLNNLKSNSSFLDLLVILCNCHEFNEIPVRHNEDKINIDLMDEILITIEKENTTPVFQKTFVVLASYLERRSLPNPEYYTDLRSILDQVFRIIQAMLSVSLKLNFPRTAVLLLIFSQCLVNQCLPFMDPVRQFGSFNECEMLSEVIPNPFILKECTRIDIERIFKKVINNSDTITHISTNIHHYPKMRIDVSTEQNDLYQGEQYKVLVRLVCENFNKIKVNHSSYVKMKEVSWFIQAVLNNQIVYHDRFTLKSVKRDFPIFIETSEIIGLNTLQIYVLSDSIFGANYYYDIPFNVTN